MLDEISIEAISDILKGIGVFIIFMPIVIILFLIMFLMTRYPMINTFQVAIFFAISFIPFIFIGIFLLVIGYMIGKKEVINERERRKREIMKRFEKQLIEIKKRK
ncbi:MAG: hypothetical protein OH319_02040 [Candidatus Parvarchaeota archaeon]|nr:hypothetical protein [Candidatus Jingweiarchaeum tengchongense]MCW1298150.1 hypothetical protein [Candidatus Jingweiarchaeum tengchongense]MCW1299949.1 hypothetical protein [Candidatus Jingweiarchaeum tengchongense]MCW1305066.1 hypothetical protein [Candidatus Jingweiarchaeum tengchongense]MCW1305571.1 hypothetical protein [Candidatus Jingweiarchaeum tengchongense]